MANAVYGKGRQSFGEGLIAWSADTIKAVIVDTAAYTVSIDVDEYLSDIPGGARIATVTLANKANVLGVFDADDLTFTSVPNTSIEALVLYKDTGVAATSRLIAYMDTATGLPFQTNLGIATITFDSGANKIFKI